MKGPTSRQVEILRVILSFTEKNGMPPTLREIGKAARIASTNGVNDHLHALERKGLIGRRDLLSRSLTLTPLGRAHATGGPGDETTLSVEGMRAALTFAANALERVGRREDAVQALRLAGMSES